jgi:hypothetical protein
MMKELRPKEDWNGAYNRGETKIQWDVDANPKRAGFKAHARFEQYFGAETVDDYLKRGGTKGDLRYDWENKFLSLTAPEGDPEPAPQAAKSAKADEAKPASRSKSKKAVDDELLS